jgi:hypothetical protein
MCEAVSVSIWHLPQTGLLIIPTLKRWPFKWECPFNRPVTFLAWDLLSFKNWTVLLAESLERKLFDYLCHGIDCQYSWCSLYIQTWPATLYQRYHKQVLDILRSCLVRLRNFLCHEIHYLYFYCWLFSVPSVNYWLLKQRLYIVYLLVSKG